MMIQQKTIYPICLYKAGTEGSMTVHNTEEQTAAEIKGWGTAYVHQEYPKWINLANDTTVLVQTEEEHTAIKLAEDELEDELD